MTAEIGVLNKQAVALAADSAVTIRGAFGHKIFNHANKLFMLSKCHPVGIMIYGNAEITGVPWETVIKMYREYLDDRNLDYLEDYSKDFLEFLNADPYGFFIDARQVDDFFGITYNYLKQIRQRIHNFIEEFIERMSEDDATRLKSDVVMELINQALEVEINHISGLPYLEGFSHRDVEELIHKYDSNIDKVIELVWKSFPKSEDIVDKLKRIVGYYFNKDIFDDYSGVVFAGFGSREIFPSMTSYILECKVNGKIKLKHDPEKTKNLNNSTYTSSLVPFAQDDMVQTIASGVDPEIDAFSLQFLQTSLNELANKLIEEIQNKMDYDEENSQLLSNNIEDITDKIFKTYVDETFNFRRQHHANPLLDTIEIMPKEELAVIAETLVNLTSFKRKISSDSETVGGPVDVALITKGDGFVWIKRKHYFDPSLNSHYFENKKRRNEL